MTASTAAPAPAPEKQPTHETPRKSDRCVILIGQTPASNHDDHVWCDSIIWTGDLYDAADIESGLIPEDVEPTSCAWSDHDRGLAWAALEDVIENLKYVARFVGYKHCKVIGHDGVILFNGWLRKQRRKAA
jgi:hypothetical protein